MTTINKKTLIEQLNWRYAVKQFDASKKVSDSDWSLLEDALVLSPSSYGLQAWKFYLVQNPELRQKMKTVSWDQSQVVDCSHFLVFAYRKEVDAAYIAKYIDEIAKVRNVDRSKLEQFESMMVGDIVNGPRAKTLSTWTSRQVYIALGNFLTAAAALGIDTCPMEGFDPQKYDELLGLNGSPYSSVVACAVGYRSVDDKTQSAKKVRFSKSELIVKK